MQTNQLLLLARIAEMGRELAQIKRSLTQPADFTKPGYLTGKDARNRLGWLLGYAPRYAVTPYTEDDKGLNQLDNGTWQAYDNSQGECFVEEFDTEAEAKAWVEGKEVSNA